MRLTCTEPPLPTRYPVGDRCRFSTVRRAELVQDVRDVDACRLGADDERRGDLAVGVAAGDEIQNLGLACGETEDLFQALLSVGRRARAPRDRPGALRRASSSSRRSGFAPIRAATAWAAERRLARAEPTATSASPGASGSRRRAVGVRAGPTSRRRRTTAPGAGTRGHAGTPPRPGRASRRRSG